MILFKNNFFLNYFRSYFNKIIFNIFVTLYLFKAEEPSFYKITFLKRKKGQVIVEYILLLVVSTVLALTLINLVTVDPAKDSPVFGYWGKLLRVIGADIST
ncbi:MAG: hypothetical protein OXC37_00850 [Bdellovibrionaceae bacterium]|nr:hypothetical protein [Pseudobdellovibrionaceae bacterium]